MVSAWLGPGVPDLATWWWRFLHPFSQIHLKNHPKTWSTILALELGNGKAILVLQVNHSFEMMNLGGVWLLTLFCHVYISCDMVIDYCNTRWPWSVAHKSSRKQGGGHFWCNGADLVTDLSRGVYYYRWSEIGNYCKWFSRSCKDTWLLFFQV